MSSKSQLLLIGESFSPWTKKARWALEYCGLEYVYKEYTPTLSEPRLRWRLRQLNGTVSVPVMFSGEQVFRGSWEIANYANQSSLEQQLGDFQVIKQWDDLSESALAQGRTEVVRRILGNNSALEESLPTFVPKLLRRPLRFVARDAVRRLDRKYVHLGKPNALIDALIKTRETLAQVDGDYLLGHFSYADITVAVVLEVISPIAQSIPPLGPATQSCWQKPDLATEFNDLIQWRDGLASNRATSYSQFN